ncbi:MAG: class I SAM-dependent methyltransferase [Vulcanimicrobiaceae bacterium]
MDKAAQIQWKTDAWKDPGMVASYAERVGDAQGWNLLKNQVEVHMFPRYVVGSDILDVGIGTGRASLPLARAGYNVTGIDSSQAMLDKCRELANGTPISLRLGDVAQLPFEAASFDTIIALNAVAHFPHLEAILRDWRRVVRPGGRMVFDAFSLDHDIAYASAIGESREYGIEHFAVKDVGSYRLRITADELVDIANRAGLRINAVIPYSAFCGQASINRFFAGSTLEGPSWNRLLSWVTADEQLYEFFLFLEEELLGHLPMAASWRYMVVLDAQADAAHNHLWLERQAEYTAALRGGPSAQTLATFGDVDVARVRGRLNELLAHEPSLYALGRILLANLPWNWPLHLNQWIDEPYLTRLQHIFDLGFADEETLRMIRGLRNDDEVAKILHHAGVNLAESLGYEMMSEILTTGFDAFKTSLEGRLVITQ